MKTFNSKSLGNKKLGLYIARLEHTPIINILTYLFIMYIDRHNIYLPIMDIRNRAKASITDSTNMMSRKWMISHDLYIRQIYENYLYHYLQVV